MNQLLQLAYWLYNYCTDFVINAANLLNLSYYEVNFLLFIILYPALIFGTSLLYLIQRWRRKQVSNSMNNEQIQ